MDFSTNIKQAHAYFLKHYHGKHKPSQYAAVNTHTKEWCKDNEFVPPNKDWAEKADYIESLYTDEAEHQEEIHKLWENRRKRLEHR